MTAPTATLNGATPILQTQGLAMAFGGLKIFDGLDFSLRRGERHAVIGPNGAGKTTFVSLLTGLLKPTRGRVLLEGQDITGSAPQERVRRGIARTFQINTLFASLTPLQSLVIALCQRDGVARPTLQATAKHRTQVDEAAARLDQFGLTSEAQVPTVRLPYGKQRLLEVALSYCLAPRVLILDEPAAGLSTAQGHQLFECLDALAAGTTILFIEHDMGLVFRYADRISVLAGGKVIAEGVPDAVRRDPEVRRAYLGN